MLFAGVEFMFRNGLAHQRCQLIMLVQGSKYRFTRSTKDDAKLNAEQNRKMGIGENYDVKL